MRLNWINKGLLVGTELFFIRIYESQNVKFENDFTNTPCRLNILEHWKKNFVFTSISNIFSCLEQSTWDVVSRP